MDGRDNARRNTPSLRRTNHRRGFPARFAPQGNPSSRMLSQLFDSHPGEEGRRLLPRILALVDVRFAVLADYAAVDPQGRFNIIGLFSDIYAAAFPLQVTNLHVALSFTANALEAGSTKALRLVLQDQDGKALVALDGQIGIPPPARPGRPSLINICLGIHNLAIPEEGAYQVCVLINGETKTVLEFSALLAPAPG